MTITPDTNYIDDAPKSTTLANFVDSLLTHSLNSGYTAMLRSAQMLGFVSHFVCPRPLSKMPQAFCLTGLGLRPKLGSCLRYIA